MQDCAGRGPCWCCNPLCNCRSRSRRARDMSTEGRRFSGDAADARAFDHCRHGLGKRHSTHHLQPPSPERAARIALSANSGWFEDASWWLPAPEGQHAPHLARASARSTPTLLDGEQMEAALQAAHIGAMDALRRRADAALRRFSQQRPEPADTRGSRPGTSYCDDATATEVASCSRISTPSPSPSHSADQSRGISPSRSARGFSSGPSGSAHSCSSPVRESQPPSDHLRGYRLLRRAQEKLDEARVALRLSQQCGYIDPSTDPFWCEREEEDWSAGLVSPCLSTPCMVYAGGVWGA